MDSVDGNTRHPATLHRYVYGVNEPTSVIDPTGKDGVDSVPNYAAMVFGLPTFAGRNRAVPLLGGKILLAGCEPGETCGNVDLMSEVPRALTYLGLAAHGDSLLSYVLGGAPITIYENDQNNNKADARSNSGQPMSSAT